FYFSITYTYLHSFPTRRSSDLLSKICGLPQMKAAWLATSGPQVMKKEALARLEVIADTFLSMNAPVQLAHSSREKCRRSLRAARDRKSTRLNSSHRTNSYAVFC